MISNLAPKHKNHKPASGNDDKSKDEEDKKPRPMVKSATDLQRLKLEKLMKNPDKPVIIPETSKDKDYLQSVPSFVRNVMGSSAGAGSGEFHVYRHLRRKEYARQKHIQAKSHREQMDDEFQNKMEQNRLLSEEKTAKKRAKRLKQKQKMKQNRGKKPKVEDDVDESVQSDEDSDDNSSEEEGRVVEVAAKPDDVDGKDANEVTADTIETLEPETPVTEEVEMVAEEPQHKLEEPQNKQEEHQNKQEEHQNEPEEPQNKPEEPQNKPEEPQNKQEEPQNKQEEAEITLVEVAQSIETKGTVNESVESETPASEEVEKVAEEPPNKQEEAEDTTVEVAQSIE